MTENTGWESLYSSSNYGYVVSHVEETKEKVEEQKVEEQKTEEKLEAKEVVNNETKVVKALDDTEETIKVLEDNKVEQPTITIKSIKIHNNVKDVEEPSQEVETNVEEKIEETQTKVAEEKIEEATIKEEVVVEQNKEVKEENKTTNKKVAKNEDKKTSTKKK